MTGLLRYSTFDEVNASELNERADHQEMLSSIGVGKGVTSGMTVSHVSAFTIRIATGAMRANKHVTFSATIDATAPTSATRYVWVDEDGDVQFTSGLTPEPGGGYVRLCKVITDGSGVTSITYEGRQIGLLFAGDTVNLGYQAVVLDRVTDIVQISRSFAYVDGANSKMGIGTTSPAGTLHVAGTDGYFQRAGANDDPFTFIFRKSRGSVATPTVIQSGDEVFRLQVQAYDGSSWVDGAYAMARATETWSGSARGSGWHFYSVANTTTTQIEALRINPDGSVGVVQGRLNIEQQSGDPSAPTDRLILYVKDDSGAALFLRDETGIRQVTKSGALYLDNPVVAGQQRMSVNTETLGANKTLVATDANMQRLTASGSNRSAILCAPAHGVWFFIVNAGASNNILVRDPTDTTTVTTLAPGEGVKIYPTGSTAAWPATKTAVAEDAAF